MTINPEFAEYIIITMMPRERHGIFNNWRIQLFVINTIIDICVRDIHTRLIGLEFVEIPLINYPFFLSRRCIIDNGEITGRVWT